MATRTEQMETDRDNRFRFKTVSGITWVANDKENPHGAMEHVINNLSAGQFPVKSWTKKEGQWWAGVTLQELERLIKRNRGLYEILPPKLRRKVYFDLDKDAFSLEDAKQKILTKFPDARFQISGRPGSYHIVLSNYTAPNLESMLHTVRDFAMENGFDEKVYARNQNFKCINQSKRDQPVQAYIEGSQSLSKHLVLHDFDDDAIDIASLDFGDECEQKPSKRKRRCRQGGEESKPKKKSRTELDIMDVPREDRPHPEHYDCLLATPSDKLALLPNPRRGSAYFYTHNLSWQVMLWCKRAGLDFEQFWAWNKQKEDTAARYKKYKHQWESSDDYSVSPKFMDVLLERYYPDINKSPSTLRFKQQFDVYDPQYTWVVQRRYLQKNDIAPPIHAEQEEVGIMRFFCVKPDDAIRKYTFLATPVGTNKTGAVVDYIGKYGANWRILWLTPRITLSFNTEWRLRQTGIQDVVNYKTLTPDAKLKGKLDNSRFVICSIQSLHYTSKPFDLVVVDEPETVFGTFDINGTTHGHHGWHLPTNWNVFIGHLRTASKVILMDAFLTDLSMNVIRRLEGDDCRGKLEIVKTNYLTQPRRFLELVVFNDWLQSIMSAAERGEKLYVFTAYKARQKKGVAPITKTLCKLMGWTEGIEILSYYADKAKEKTELANAEELWGNPTVRCIVTNSTISVGVNFNQKDVFDKIFGLYTPLITVRDFIQSLYRIRHPKETDMILYREKSRTYGNLRDKIVRHPDCDIYQQMQCDREKEWLANNNTDEWQTFNMMCEKSNITIIPSSTAVSDETNERYLDAYAQKCELCFAWERIRDIEYSEVNPLRIKTFNSKATLDEHLALSKYFFRQKFDTDADEGDLEYLWHKRNFIDKYIALLLDPDHIINRVLEGNGVSLGKELPPRMKRIVSMDEVCNMFRFDRRISDMETGVVAQMLNAHFGMVVYSWDKQKQSENKRVYAYKTNEDFLIYCRLCARNTTQGRHFKRRCDPEAELLL